MLFNNKLLEGVVNEMTKKKEVQEVKKFSRLFPNAFEMYRVAKRSDEELTDVQINMVLDKLIEAAESGYYDIVITESLRDGTIDMLTANEYGIVYTDKPNTETIITFNKAEFHD
jgi:hypothetical protein